VGQDFPLILGIAVELSAVADVAPVLVMNAFDDLLDQLSPAA
jgi:hypothetical protein